MGRMGTYRGWNGDSLETNSKADVKSIFSLPRYARCPIADEDPMSAILADMRGPGDTQVIPAMTMD